MKGLLCSYPCGGGWIGGGNRVISGSVSGGVIVGGVECGWEGREEEESGVRGGYGGDSVCCRVIGGGCVGGVGGCAGRGGGVDCGEAISGGGVRISSVTCGSCEGLKVLLRFLPCEGGIVVVVVGL